MHTPLLSYRRSSPAKLTSGELRFISQLGVTRFMHQAQEILHATRSAASCTFKVSTETNGGDDI